LPYVDVRLALTRGGDERRRGIDRRDGRGAESVDQLGRERTRPAPDIEHTLARLDAGEVRQLSCQEGRIAPHEAVVGFRGDGKGHTGTLAPANTGCSSGFRVCPGPGEVGEKKTNGGVTCAQAHKDRCVE